MRILGGDRCSLCLFKVLTCQRRHYPSRCLVMKMNVHTILHAGGNIGLINFRLAIVNLYTFKRNPLISWKSDVDAGCVGIVVIWWQILTMLGFHNQPLMSQKIFRD